MLPIDLLSKVPWVPLQRPSLLGPTARLGQCLTWLLCLLQSKKDTGLAGWGGPSAVSSARGLVRERANLSISVRSKGPGLPQGLPWRRGT